MKFLCGLVLIVIALVEVPASAQGCSGGCSSGVLSSAGISQSSSQNDAIIQSQQQQIQELQSQIQSLSVMLQQRDQIAQLRSNLNQVTQARNLRATEQRLVTGNPRRGDVVQVGVADRDPVIQRVQQVTAPPQPRLTQAPIIRQVQAVPQPRTVVRSSWR